MSMVFRYISRGLSTSFDVDLGTDAVRLGSIQGFAERAAHIQSAGSSVIIDDPDGDVGEASDAIIGLQFFRVDETDMAAGNQLLYLALITNRAYERGDSSRPSLRTGVGRQITVSLNDLNSLTGLEAIPKADTTANRPAETVGDRLTWILASSYLSGIVGDAGLVTYPSVMMTAADYRTQRPSNVINDCEMAGRYYAFVYPDESATPIASLFFDNANTSTAYLSDIFLTNDLSLVDNINVFAIEPDVRLQRSPDDLGSHVLLPYKSGTVSRTLSTTADVYGVKSLIAPNANVTTSSKANDIGDDFLDEHATEEDTITGTVKLPTDAVNRLRAGQRVGIWFTHLPGYNEWKWARVTQRAPAQRETSDQLYQVPLELSPQEPLDDQSGLGPAPSPPVLAYLDDLFTRTGSGWGDTTDGAHLWTEDYADGTVTVSTNGSQGVIEIGGDVDGFVDAGEAIYDVNAVDDWKYGVAVFKTTIDVPDIVGGADADGWDIYLGPWFDPTLPDYGLSLELRLNYYGPGGAGEATLTASQSPSHFVDFTGGFAARPPATGGQPLQVEFGVSVISGVMWAFIWTVTKPVTPTVWLYIADDALSGSWIGDITSDESRVDFLAQWDGTDPHSYEFKFDNWQYEQYLLQSGDIHVVDDFARADQSEFGTPTRGLPAWPTHSGTGTATKTCKIESNRGVLGVNSGFPGAAGLATVILNNPELAGLSSAEFQLRLTMEFTQTDNPPGVYEHVVTIWISSNANGSAKRCMLQFVMDPTGVGYLEARDDSMSTAGFPGSGNILTGPPAFTAPAGTFDVIIDRSARRQSTKFYTVQTGWIEVMWDDPDSTGGPPTIEITEWLRADGANPVANSVVTRAYLDLMEWAYAGT